MIKKGNKKFWQNPWIVGIGSIVIGTAILKVLVSLFGNQFLSKLPNFIKDTIGDFSSFIGLSYKIPIWGIFLIFLSGIGLFLLWAWFSSETEALKNEPKFLSYTEDQFNEILYKWKYELNFEGKYYTTNFTPYCPDDNCILHHGKCPVCNKYFDKKLKQSSELEKLVLYKIQNNLKEKSIT